MVDPMMIISQVGIRPTDSVADFGAGSGAYTIPVARIAKEGKVYCVEVLKDLLTRVKNDADKMHLSNIEYIWGDIERLGGTKIKDGVVDIVIIANVLFQVPSKQGLIGEAKRILKQGGRVLLVDWIDSFGGLGPQSGDIISEDKAKQLFSDEGFSFDNKLSIKEHHYAIIFKKQ